MVPSVPTVPTVPCLLFVLSVDASLPAEPVEMPLDPLVLITVFAEPVILATSGLTFPVTVLGSGECCMVG